MIRPCLVLVLTIAAPAAASSYLEYDIPEIEFASEKQCAAELDRLLAQVRVAKPGETLEAYSDATSVTLVTREALQTVSTGYFCRYKSLVGKRTVMASSVLPPPLPLPLPLPLPQ